MAPLLDEEEGILTTRMKAIDVDLALSNVHPPQSSLLKNYRSCAYTASEVYPIIEVGQMSQTGKEGATCSVTAEEGGVHKSIAGGYSS